MCMYSSFQYQCMVLVLYTVTVFTDLADLNLPKTCQMDFPDPDDLLNFRLVIMPDEVHAHCTCTIYLCVYTLYMCIYIVHMCVQCMYMYLFIEAQWLTTYSAHCMIKANVHVCNMVILCCWLEDTIFVEGSCAGVTRTVRCTNHYL